MKTILLACDRSNMDAVLRRSVALLVKSCQIEIAHDGFRVFDELRRKAFDLIIIDFEIPGADSLELVECIQYIDPGVPVILMLGPKHKALGDTIRHLKAHPITRPFKLLTFLRLVDRLLHQHLNRYRQLAGTLKVTLDTLRQTTEGICALLVDEAGQVLIAAGEIEGLSPEELGCLLAETALAGDRVQELENQTFVMPAHSPAMQAYGLHMTRVIEGLHLVLVVSAAANPARTPSIWCEIGLAAGQLKTTLYQQTPALSARSRVEADPEGEVLRHRFISFQLDPAPRTLNGSRNFVEKGEPNEEWADEAAINWAILADTPDLVSRLRDFCQLG